MANLLRRWGEFEIFSDVIQIDATSDHGLARFGISHQVIERISEELGYDFNPIDDLQAFMYACECALTQRSNFGESVRRISVGFEDFGFRPFGLLPSLSDRAT